MNLPALAPPPFFRGCRHPTWFSQPSGTDATATPLAGQPQLLEGTAALHLAMSKPFSSRARAACSCASRHTKIHSCRPTVVPMSYPIVVPASCLHSQGQEPENSDQPVGPRLVVGIVPTHGLCTRALSSSEFIYGGSGVLFVVYTNYLKDHLCMVQGLGPEFSIVVISSFNRVYVSS